ncbi:hypothetical protein EIN_409080 [Entamoeba invadens IP1]|uniref:60S ribosomal protein L7 n=1 Tax=Entamoeba invadens IP1 TaxID=370355 RepID=A0A0A1TWM0_ENTIV|nr:hypothetical protein EIN_409080 [Entamoeba invadens IP1]ELP85619.1 hypothetical protein EIN_409080 [Entamoeba invadens IP1]|eukprot:XP_004184965.1 hypothetical protein EIN_409080 [Entamoeba invadens IP1]
MSSTQDIKPNERVVIKRTTINRIVEARQKRRELRERLSVIRKKKNRVTIKISLYSLLQKRRSLIAQESKKRRVERNVLKGGVAGIEGLIAVITVKNPRTAAYYTKDFLNELDINKQFTVRFIHADDEIIKKLYISENYVLFGKVTEDTVRQLILKKGEVIVNGVPCAIKSNKVVRDAFAGKYDEIECVEDLVNAVLDKKYAEYINKILCPFQVAGTDSEFIKTKNGHVDNLDEALIALI